MMLFRLVKPGDRVLLVSCSYGHQPASGPDFFKNYTTLAEKLKVCVWDTTVWDTSLCYLTRSISTAEH
jgi:hypothetical protein